MAGWEKYVSGVLVILLLVFTFPYVDAELSTSNFTDNTLGSAAGVIVPLLYVMSIIVLTIVLIVTATRDIQKG